MMVQAVENKPRKVNGVTVIDVPAKAGSRLGTTILIDNGFSGYAIMTYPFASQLGYEFQRDEGKAYNTAGGTLNTKLQVTIDNIRLPHLSRHRSFSATIEIAPESSGDFGYGMIMGIIVRLTSIRTQAVNTRWELYSSKTAK
jgi:predicted aspartyl protease